mmetsp:Transcript_76283/g.218603  ORF Transcript_76283/g.218603 Transcript_76283/m.218603 type:complete len:283 (+) Transcript_76283:509-1357(+)
MLVGAVALLHGLAGMLGARLLGPGARRGQFLTAEVHVPLARGVAAAAAAYVGVAMDGEAREPSAGGKVLGALVARSASKGSHLVDVHTDALPLPARGVARQRVGLSDAARGLPLDLFRRGRLNVATASVGTDHHVLQSSRSLPGHSIGVHVLVAREGWGEQVLQHVTGAHLCRQHFDWLVDVRGHVSERKRLDFGSRSSGAGGCGIFRLCFRLGGSNSVLGELDLHTALPQVGYPGGLVHFLLRHRRWCGVIRRRHCEWRMVGVTVEGMGDGAAMSRDCYRC